MLGKIWNTVRSSSGDIRLSLPHSCFLIAFRQGAGAQSGLFWAWGNLKRQESSNVTSLKQCLKKGCANAILELDTSVSLRPCSGCLHPRLGQASWLGGWLVHLFLNLWLIYCPQDWSHDFFPGCTFTVTQMSFNRHIFSQISVSIYLYSLMMSLDEVTISRNKVLLVCIKPLCNHWNLSHLLMQNREGWVTGKYS